MNVVLFLGTFLSNRRGTKPVSERVAAYLKHQGYEVNLVSNQASPTLRLFDYFFCIVFKKFSFAVVDVFSDRSFFLAEWAVFWLKLRRRPVVLTLRGGKLAEFSARNKGRVRRLFAKADLVQTPSLYLKSEFENNGLKICYLPNPIDLRQFPFKPLSSRQQAFSILWVRAFSEIYNPKMPVQVLALLAKEFPNARLTMVGPDGGLLDEVQRLVNQLGLKEKVSIVGRVRNEQLYQYYQSHDVYLNTTSYESFGVAMVEAASCGIPIVSHSVGEVPYLWRHGEEILMVDKGDIEGMAKCVQSLFNDRDLAAALSQSAREKAERFTWENISPQWKSLLKRFGVIAALQ